MTDERIIAYLLGELSERESEQFEDECFALESWPEQLEAAEDELIDDYLRGELAKERRERFERNYLTTEARRKRVLLAAALLRRVDEYNAAQEAAAAATPDEPTLFERLGAFWKRQTFALRAAASVAALAFVVGALWFSLFRTSQPRSFTPLALTISASDRAQGPQAGRVKLPLSTDALRISLALPEQASVVAAHYRIELEKDDGETKTLDAAERDAQSVSVIIPAAELARGQYALRLFMTGDDGTERRIPGSYFFNVE